MGTFHIYNKLVYVVFQVLLIAPKLIVFPLLIFSTLTDASTQCLDGISLDFRNFTYTLAIGVKSIILITRPSSLAQDAPITVSVIKILFHLCGVNLSSNLHTCN